MDTKCKVEEGSRTESGSRATCPRCEGGFGLKGRLMIGEVFDCPHCGAPLEIAELEPLAIEPFARIDDEE